MPTLVVHLEGDGCWPDLDRDKIVHLGNAAPPIHVACLERGVSSGRPSVGFRLDLPNGQVVIAETSVRLFLHAADLVRLRYGEMAEGGLPS